MMTNIFLLSSRSKNKEKKGKKEKNEKKTEFPRLFRRNGIPELVLPARSRPRLANRVDVQPAVTC